MTDPSAIPPTGLGGSDPSSSSSSAPSATAPTSVVDWDWHKIGLLTLAIVAGLVVIVGINHVTFQWFYPSGPEVAATATSTTTESEPPALEMPAPPEITSASPPDMEGVSWHSLTEASLAEGRALLGTDSALRKAELALARSLENQRSINVITQKVDKVTEDLNNLTTLVVENLIQDATSAQD